ncbi:methylmalonyl-CoA mutase family protein [Hymenobacter sp. BT175]|uniref:methylmalonyl-CoA mutase family protein n=1 Tax=Hymenobacter translucens TaxID=2886507 RepID=UPI001D0E8E15|nr:methylmalonyl-CoA mutase family protein [Hymenobacter translucens]MCC2546975.1 methylmalonyl-CoA mutase family protein [Hymenobacter translucens]
MADTPPPVPVSFSEFEPVTTATWQDRIRRDLKGADPATLAWNTPEGFAVEPFYHREALENLASLPAPQVPASTAWRNVPTYAVGATHTGRAAIDRAARALQRGADGAHFVIANPVAFDVSYLHQLLPLTSTYVGFTISSGSGEFVQRLLATGTPTLRGFLQCDPITDHGPDLHRQISELRTVVELTRAMPDFRALTLNGAFFANRGGSISQQLAFILAAATAYLDQLPDETVTLADVAAALHVHTAIATSYFFEIAKLRALRQLWATLLDAYGLPVAAGLPAVFASTATWTQTTLDPHNNLLRATTEAMSAVLGGVQGISIAPFDSIYHGPNEFSERLARNLPVLLREEALLNRVTDPAAGSYYIETLTDQLAREGWALFQRVEAEGGLPHAIGFVMQQIQESAQVQFSRIAAGEQVVVGTNKFQNPKEDFDYNPKKLLRSREFDTTRAAYPTEVLRLATALHFQRREKKRKRAAIVLLGPHTNQLIMQSFLRMLPGLERPDLLASHPPGTLSVLFSSPEAATLMYATPEQYGVLARTIARVHEDDTTFVPPTLLTADLATMQEAVHIFGFQEFTVDGYSTDDVLARLQGR